MIELKHYENGYSPSALQRKYGLSYEHGYELAQDFKRLQEQLHEANEVIKEYADSSNWSDYYNEYSDSIVDDCIFYDSAGWAVPKDYLKKWGVK